MSSIKCSFCGMFHDHKCPLVKAYEYHPDGSVKRIEFMTLNDLRTSEPRQFLAEPVDGTLQ